MQIGQFDRHLSFFAGWRSKTDEVIQPEITFDDGHVSNYEYALPLLTEHGIKARFFLTAGWISSRAEWMDWSHVRALHAAGHAIGAHGWSHTLLTHASPAALVKELHTAKALLEDKLSTPVTSMSFPGGRYNRRVLDACREAGYTELYTSAPKVETSPLGELIGRCNIQGNVDVTRLSNLLQNEKSILALQRNDRCKTALKALLGDRLYARCWEVVNHGKTSLPSVEGVSA